jgi:hypothetical protein
VSALEKVLSKSNPISKALAKEIYKEKQFATNNPVIELTKDRFLKMKSFTPNKINKWSNDNMLKMEFLKKQKQGETNESLGWLNTQLSIPPSLPAVREIYLKESERGKGLATKSYEKVAQLFGGLQSDEMVSAPARKIWDRLKKKDQDNFLEAYTYIMKREPKKSIFWADGTVV